MNLEEFANTKVSKLSGGQKQRVAIARAIAKETDIIVADEPTGNLDSKSAESVIKLLSEIAKDKLIVVVTHNYDQFEAYATRRIKMNDGRISEDEIIKKVTPALNNKKDVLKKQAGQISLKNKLRLGGRNVLNIVPKFLLLMVVFIFLVFAVVGEYGTLKKSEAELTKNGYNIYFTNQDETRIVLNNKDKKPLGKKDYTKISKLSGVKNVEKNDIALDSGFWMEGPRFSLDGQISNVNQFEGKLKYGRMPKKNNEIILEVNNKNYYFRSEDEAKEIIGEKIKLHESNTQYDSGADTDLTNLKVVGIAYSDNVDNWKSNMYMKPYMVKHVKMNAIMYNSNTKIKMAGTTVNDSDGELRLVINKDIEEGRVYGPEILNSYYSSGSAVGNTLEITMSNIYGKNSKTLKVDKILTKKNLKSTLGIDDYDICSNVLFINPKDMEALTSKSDYQYSVFVNDISRVDETVKKLQEMGYNPLAIKDTIKVYQMEELMFKVVKVPMIVFLILTMFFISYFVIKLILKSRSGYYIILRILGMNNKNAKRILDIELLIDANIAFALLLICIAVVRAGFINIEYLVTMLGMITAGEIILLYVVIMAMVYMISRRYAKSLFKKSAMVTFREEV